MFVEVSFAYDVAGVGAAMTGMDIRITSNKTYYYQVVPGLTVPENPEHLMAVLTNDKDRLVCARVVRCVEDADLMMSPAADDLKDKKIQYCVAFFSLDTYYEFHELKQRRKRLEEAMRRRAKECMTDELGIWEKLAAVDPTMKSLLDSYKEV